jgi:hypothetical protein
MPSATQLVLQNRIIFVWIFGFVMISFGVVVLFMLGGKNTIICSRSGKQAGKCQIISSSLLVSHTTQLALKDLQGAELDVSSSSDSDTYRVVLLTTQGKMPLTSYYGSSSGSQQSVVEQVNAFLKDPALKSLLTTQDEGALPFIIALLMVGFGILIIFFFGRPMTYDFDKASGLLTVTHTNLNNASEHEYPLHDIKGVTIDTSYSGRSGTYRVVLLMADGVRLPMTTFLSSGLKDKQLAAAAIKEFLGLEENNS